MKYFSLQMRYLKAVSAAEVVDPICLGAKLADYNEGCCKFNDDDIAELGNIPDCVRRVFDDRFIVGRDQQRRVYVSLGLFTIIKLERNVQLLIPAYDFCIPEKECVGAATPDDPCDLFEKISFPIDEFFPPQQDAFSADDTPNCRPGCSISE